MFKTECLVIALLSICSIATSDPQTLENNGVSPDELHEDIDDNGRAGASAKAFAVASPAATRMLPAPGVMNTHQCYVCTDCPKVLANTTYKACPYSADTTKNNKCVVYSEQFKNMKKPLILRGCGSERGSCEDIKRAHVGHEDVVKLNYCYECEGDKCNVNGGSRLPASLVAFFALIVTPLLAKHTLS